MEQERIVTSPDGKDRRSKSPDKDDSLTDFKSPKGQLAAPTISGKSKVVKTKRTKKSSTKASASNKKKEASLSGVGGQTLIESSFFKSKDSGQKEAHTCPLCMKYFEDKNTGRTHTKSCAAKNKVSTSKLLAAVALQQRQADERIAIGLPAGPVSRAKDNNSKRIHRPSLKNDPDLQLALALSKSLQENEADRELEEALLLGPVGDTRDTTERRRTLKNFGFSTNKPAGFDTAPIKPRRKKHLGPTILQTRSQESRERILTDRIAEILMGNEPITQIAQQESLPKINQKPSVVAPKSRLLNEIYQTTKRLWESAGLSNGVTNFYVQDLVEFISSPGLERQNLPTLENKQTDCERVSHQDQIEAPPIIQLTSNEFHIGSNNRVSEEMLRSPKNSDCEYHNTLQIDWANTLNVSTMSDVVVLVKNNHIWAHRLVFYVRCSNILLDCQPMNDSKFRHVKEKIDWPDVDYLAALAFLEFVYSGLIVKYESVLSDNGIVTAIESLARKYRLKDLFEYMRKRKSQVNKRTEEPEGRKSGLKSPIIIQVPDENSQVEKVSDNSVNTSVATVNSPQDSEAVLKSNTFHSTIEETDEYSSVSTTPNAGQTCDMKSIENLSDVGSSRSRSMSPDLFDDTSEEPIEDAATNCSEVIETNVRVSNGDNSNLKILAQLISNDNSSSSAEADKSETSITSAATVVDDDQSPKIPSSHSPLPCTTDTVTEDDDQAQQIIEKPKSNLSIFIEKVQKINAKSAVDSYTEEDSLGISYVYAKRRNPFGINNDTDKSILNSTHEANTHGEQYINPKEGLSSPEKKNSVVDMNESSLIEPSELENSSVLDDTIESTDYENMSIYSRYKKIHQHNSIMKYRNSPIKLTDASAAEIFEDDDKNDNSSALNDEAIDLTQESDTEPESSPASSVVRFNRSRGNNRALVVSDSDSFLSGERNERREKILVGSRQCGPATLQEESINITSPVASSSRNGKYLGASPEYPESCSRQQDRNYLSQRLTNSKTINSSPRRSDVINKSAISDAKYLADLEKEHDSPPPSSDVSSKGTKSLTHSSLYPELDVFQVDDQMFTESFVTTQSSRRKNASSSSPKTKPNALPRKRKAEDANFVNTPQKDYEKDPVESPTSSPNSAQGDDVFHCDDDLIFTQSFKSPRVSPFRALTPSPGNETNKKDSEKNESLRVSSPILISSSPDMDIVGIDGCGTEIRDFNKENVCLITDINSGPSLSRNSPSPSNLEIPQSPKAGPSRQRFSPDCTKATPRTTKNSLVRWKSMPTETSNTRSGLKRKTPTKSSRLVLSQNVTPPLNYDNMDTPELRLELDKYGIKPQKAHRARQLLTHIYNELCTQVPSTDSDAARSSDADEPPVKKIGRNGNDSSDDSEAESVTRAVAVIPEELEIIDAHVELSDDDNASSKITIKQAFTALIKDDKELHNKMLIYEPLSLELLHVMLTARGFKCKVNDLMDFLDQECITFQVQDQPRRRRGAKVRTKTTIGSRNQQS